MTKKLIYRLALLGLLISVLTISGCSGDDDEFFNIESKLTIPPKSWKVLHIQIWDEPGSEDSEEEVLIQWEHAERYWNGSEGQYVSVDCVPVSLIVYISSPNREDIYTSEFVCEGKYQFRKERRTFNFQFYNNSPTETAYVRWEVANPAHPVFLWED